MNGLLSEFDREEFGLVNFLMGSLWQSKRFSIFDFRFSIEELTDQSWGFEILEWLGREQGFCCAIVAN